jgi:hypothetical protein
VYNRDPPPDETHPQSRTALRGEPPADLRRQRLRPLQARRGPFDRRFLWQLRDSPAGRGNSRDSPGGRAPSPARRRIGRSHPPPGMVDAGGRHGDPGVPGPPAGPHFSLLGGGHPSRLRRRNPTADRDAVRHPDDRNGLHLLAGDRHRGVPGQEAIRRGGGRGTGGQPWRDRGTGGGPGAVRSYGRGLDFHRATPPGRPAPGAARPSRDPTTTS